LKERVDASVSEIKKFFKAGRTQGKRGRDRKVKPGKKVGGKHTVDQNIIEEKNIQDQKVLAVNILDLTVGCI